MNENITVRLSPKEIEMITGALTLGLEEHSDEAEEGEVELALKIISKLNK